MSFLKENEKNHIYTSLKKKLNLTNEGKCHFTENCIILRKAIKDNTKNGKISYVHGLKN